MPLREHFGTSGNWLFRWRSYLPLVLFVPVIAVMAIDPPVEGGQMADRLWEGLCLLVAVIGAVVRIVAVGSAPAGTSGRNTAEGQVASTVNTTGLYSLVRHPLYVGNYLMWMGPALLPRHAWLALSISLAYWLYYERIMFAEEEFLRAKFGAEYERWASATPAFVPGLGHPIHWRPAALPFSGRSALRREYSGWLGVVGSFLLLDFVGESATYGEPHVDPMWLVIFGVTLVVYLVLRTLKKRTGVLKVEGR
ncbi:MAG: DUF1295 domain-containing protein [Gemmatirosa sp.]|nr:DUF1295 domain-containing protein [Gemmatirosa sp.]